MIIVWRFKQLFLSGKIVSAKYFLVFIFDFWLIKQYYVTAMRLCFVFLGVVFCYCPLKQSPIAIRNGWCKCGRHNTVS